MNARTRSRTRLRNAAIQIAKNNNRQLDNSAQCLMKLIISTDRKTKKWKPGELIEFALACYDDKQEEWGDVGYYIARTPLWPIYLLVTRQETIERAVVKFEARAQQGKLIK